MRSSANIQPTLHVSIAGVYCKILENINVKGAQDIPDYVELD